MRACLRACVDVYVITCHFNAQGLFNNFQVPFSFNVTVTVEMVGEKGHLVIFWMVLRGRTNAATLHLPGTPSVLLPAAARLRTYYTPNVTLQPLQQLPLYVQCRRIVFIEDIPAG